MDYNKLFEEDAFKNINPEILEKFKKLALDVKGKNANEMVLQIVKFYNSMPKDTKLSKKESDALIHTILTNMPSEERKRFLNMIDILNNMT